MEIARFLVLCPVLIVVLWGFSKAWFRVAWFTVGAFFVFQTGDGMSPPKLVYLVGVAVCVVIAVGRMKATLGTREGRTFIPAICGAGLLGAWLVGVTLPISVGVFGVSLLSWSRDALTYLLICAAVVIGVDAVDKVSLRFSRGLTILVGLIAAVGFAAVWTERRGFTDDATTVSSQGLLASMVALTLPIALAYCLGMGRKRMNLLWLMVAVGFLVSVLVTGTRTGAVLVLIALGVVGSQAKMRVSIRRASLGLVAAASATALALPLAGAFFSSREFVEQRIQSILSVASGGLVVDQSGVIRARAYDYAWQIFQQKPIFGQGVGVLFPNPNPNGVAMNYALDTPYTYLAKFGIAGAILLVVTLILILSPMLRRGAGPWITEMTVLRGAIVAWIAILPFGPVTDDKGFPVSIALAFLLVGTARKQWRLRHDALGRRESQDEAGHSQIQNDPHQISIKTVEI